MTGSGAVNRRTSRLGRHARHGVAPRGVAVHADAPVPREAVWCWLADAGSFARWVSGTRAVRSADPGWPAPGAALRHCWGPWPVRVRDRTTVLACHAPESLDLDARVGPIARVHVRIRLIETGTGTRILLGETVESGLARCCPPLTRRIQRWRNGRSLAALVALVCAGDAAGRARARAWHPPEGS